jgi:hypothetical protein
MDKAAPVCAPAEADIGMAAGESPGKYRHGKRRVISPQRRPNGRETGRRPELIEVWSKSSKMDG